jgi:hypothetical protein
VKAHHELAAVDSLRSRPYREEIRTETQGDGSGTQGDASETQGDALG